MKNQTKETLLKPSELLRNALGLYSKKIGTLLGIMAVPVLFNLIALYFHLSADLLGDISIGMTSAILSIWAYLCLIYVLKNKGLTVKKAFLKSKERILSYILINFLIAIATIPGILLLGIPTVIYMVWFSFSAFVLIEEDYHGGDALMRSREYVTGRWGKVAWRMFLIILILVIFQYLGDFLARLMIPFVTPLTAYNPKIIAKLVSGIFENLIVFITIPLSLTYTYLLYLNLKKTRPELAGQPVNNRYKWLYILSPTTVLILLVVLAGIFLQIANGT